MGGGRAEPVATDCFPRSLKMLIPILISAASLLVPADPSVSPPDVTSARSLSNALRV